MNAWNNFIVSDIQPPFVVHSKSGQAVQMENRPHYGLSLCMSGQITYTMHGKSYISNPSNAVFLPKGGTYSLLGDKEGLFPVINFEAEHIACNEITILPLNSPQRCIQDFEVLKSLYQQGVNRLKIYSVFYELLSNVFSGNLQKSEPVVAVIKYIEENLQDSALSNTKLARHIGISEVYLRKQFLLYYGITPKQYILDVRIRKAKQLLVDTPFTVTAIAEECGFSSVYHFCRAFKQRTGQTPTKYAMTNRIYKI